MTKFLWDSFYSSCTGQFTSLFLLGDSSAKEHPFGVDRADIADGLSNDKEACHFSGNAQRDSHVADMRELEEIQSI